MAQTPTSAAPDTSARLLVVDHDPNELAALGALLVLLGYQVEEASSAHKALLLETVPCELMLLEPWMPGVDGGELMRRARRICPDLAIIVLTAHPTLESAIAAVKVGAADYALKPPNIADLGAMISQALQQRAEELSRQQLLHLVENTLRTLYPTNGVAAPSPSPPPTNAERFLQAGSITLDRHKRLAVVKGMRRRSIELTEGEAAILTALMERAEQVLSCKQLARAAMGCELYEKQAQSLVRPYIFRLRRKIEPSPDDPLLIRTVRGRGYFLSFGAFTSAVGAT